MAGAGIGFAGLDSARAKTGEMPMRTLGRTKEKVSLIGLGGWHLGKVEDEATALRIVRTAIDNGITFMDTCWDYQDGKSETWMGKALRDGYRQKVFLMTKLDGQTKESATKQIEDSLRRLQTDVIDLLQFHEIIRPGDAERIFSAGGMEAVLAAKKAGKVRYIGFTGHKAPGPMLNMIATGKKHGFVFDACQMPINLLDHHYQSFEKEVLPLLLQDDTAVLAMKTLAEGHIFKTHTVTATEAHHYAMSLPISVLVSGMETLERLEQSLASARTFKPLDEKTIAALRARTAPHAASGEFEPFKTTHFYDGTIQNPQWLG
jgi:aryl-alcohol dehydrogenase-like predicted oxidoreductase